mgnify:FL=1
MAKPNSRETLIDYCLRNLGAPVIEINVDDDQLDDRIDEALQFYQHYHTDAIEKVFLKEKIDYTKLVLPTEAEAAAFTVGETITLSNSTVLTTVAITDVAGNFTCDAANIAVGDRITISDSFGTADGVGSITGYTSVDTEYKVSAIVGTAPAVTGFTLTEVNDTALVTTAGTMGNVILTLVNAAEEEAIATVVSKSKNVLSINNYNPIDKNAFIATNEIIGTTSKSISTISSVTIGAIDYRYINIPDLVTDVIRVLPIRDHSSSTSLFDVKYQMHLNDMYSLGYMGSLLDYTMAKQYLSTIDVLIDSDDKFVSFDRHRDRLRIDMDWKNEVQIGSYIVVEGYRIIDPSTFTDVYNDYFLKKYATALIKKQWGANLIKFEGMTMPGGVTFNGRQLFDDAIEELQRLEEEVRLNWEQPVDFYVG